MHILKTPSVRHARGFTLIEIAIALIVFAVLAGAAIAALRTQMIYSRVAQTREQLREAREALASYAVAEQALPCPAEDRNGIANTTSSCASKYKGFLPWQTLGLASTDAWGNPLRYAVSSGFVSSATLTFATTGSLDVLVGGVNIDPAHAIAFAVWSTGEDATDASVTDPSATPAISEAMVVAEAPGSDDLMEWTSRYVLFGKMLAAARTLPLAPPPASASSSSAASSSGG